LEDVGAWFNALEQPKIVVTPEIRAKAEEVTKGKTTEDEKIHALYDFVSTHLRYIGVDLGLGRYAPHAAADVLANRYGDCKDKHTLFAALLQAVGIPAYPALISSRYRVDAALPSPSLFDHVITAIPRGDTIFFLDTTPEVAPYGLLLQNLRDRQALVIPPSIAARLVLTPADPPFRGFETSVIQPEDTSQPFWLSFAYHRTDFPDWKNHRITLPTPFFFLRELTDEQKLFKDPLPFGSPQDVTYETSVKFPKDYSPVLPENFARKLDFAEFTADYSVDKAGVLHGTLHFKTLLPEVPGEKRKDFSGLAKSIEETTRRYIFISGDSPASENTPPILRRMKPDKPEEMIPRLEQDLAGHPDHRTSLLMLSEAYIKAGRSKDAAALLEKTLATSPDDPDQLYYALGHAYLGIPDVDRAIAQFQKALGDKPEPPVLNSVAYSLADANVHLGDALDYSNRAVTAVSARTMEISSDDAETSDFGLMTELAADWDTLGWIKFRQADVAAAEKYILSAWQLMQVPDIGEHLVEIYEKLGKKQAAARICFMAQAAPGRGPTDKKLSDEMARLRPFLKTAGAPPSKLYLPDGPGALSEMRTINVPYTAKVQTDSLLAHFVISMTSGSKVDNVVFVSGSEELRNSIAAFAATKYPQSLPDDTPVRIIRKGTFSCSKYTRQCVLVLIPVFDAALPAN
jgi:tetratricopeptide (TPR) repeat protein